MSEFYVSIDLKGQVYKVGKVYYTEKRGKKQASFKYDSSWVNNKIFFDLQPSLAGAGKHYTRNGEPLLGAISDSAPDTWGRELIKWYNLKTNRKQTILEQDFLLGVNDFSRIGALRFSLEPDGPYLTENHILPIPPIIKLPELLSATQDYLNKNINEANLQLILAPGSSLGGARPKASIIKDGKLHIAKFLTQSDTYNKVRWEAVCLDLARSCGITTCDFEVITVDNKDVLILKRFDRDENQNRIPFLSAMSMLNTYEGDSNQSSYLDIFDKILIYNHSDLEELYRRLVFNAMVSNFDDHLRNHAFLYLDKTWKLSPAYDITPLPNTPRRSCLLITESSPLATLQNLRDVGEAMKINNFENIINEIDSIVATWEDIANKYALSSIEKDYVRSSFEHECRLT